MGPGVTESSTAPRHAHTPAVPEQLWNKNPLTLKIFHSSYVWSRLGLDGAISVLKRVELLQSGKG